MQKTPLMLKTHVHVQASIYQAKWIFLNFNSTGLQNVPHHYVLGVHGEQKCFEQSLFG